LLFFLFFAFSEKMVWNLSSAFLPEMKCHKNGTSSKKNLERKGIGLHMVLLIQVKVIPSPSNHHRITSLVTFFQTFQG